MNPSSTESECFAASGRRHADACPGKGRSSVDSGPSTVARTRDGPAAEVDRLRSRFPGATSTTSSPVEGGVDRGLDAWGMLTPEPIGARPPDRERPRRREVRSKCRSQTARGSGDRPRGGESRLWRLVSMRYMHGSPRSNPRAPARSPRMPVWTLPGSYRIEVRATLRRRSGARSAIKDYPGIRWRGKAEIRRGVGRWFDDSGRFAGRAP